MTALLILALVGAAVTTVFTFTSARWAPGVALATLFLAFFGMPASHRVPSELIYMGVAALVALALNYLQHPDLARSRRGVGYLTLGGLAGGMLIYLAGVNWTVLGVVCGALLGSLAWARTPAGSRLAFPSRRFVEFLAAKGLPVMVNISIVCMAVYQACFTLVNG